MKMGGYPKSKIGRGSQGNVRVPEVWVHSYCKIPPKRVKGSCGLGILKQLGLLRVNAESSNFSKDLLNKGFFLDRFVSIPSITSDTNLSCMESRSSVMPQMYFKGIEHANSLYAFSPFCLIPKVLNKTLKEKVPKLIFITQVWMTQI